MVLSGVDRPATTVVTEEAESTVVETVVGRPAQVNAGQRASLTTGHVVSGVEKGAGTRRYSVPGAQVYCRGPGPSCVFLRRSKFNENLLKLLSVSHYATLKVDHTRLPSVGFRS